MLTADRPEYARRAVECFRRQTYPAKRLLIYDTGTDDAEDCPGDYPLVIWIPEESRGRTIGELRNAANSHVEGVEVDLSAGTSKDCGADILIHWDDDDYSHPNRIAEQVALLQSSGADVVGYRECLFWRETPQAIKDHYAEVQRRYPTDPNVPMPAHLQLRLGEAWLYSNPDPRYCLGTSLCYWRKTWERKPFEATSQGEDIRFCTGLKCIGIPSTFRWMGPSGSGHDDLQPRMIARIHSGNTSTVYRPELMAAIERQGGEWKRVPEWDSYCRGVME